MNTNAPRSITEPYMHSPSSEECRNRIAELEEQLVGALGMKDLYFKHLREARAMLIVANLRADAMALIASAATSQLPSKGE